MKRTKACASGLLELLAFKAGCLYISELRCLRRLPMLWHAIRSISPEQYSLREWSDAVQYITGQEYVFQDQIQAAALLETYVRKKGADA